MSEHKTTDTSAKAQPYPRTHEILAGELTRDPIYLLQTKQPAWAACASSVVGWDSDAETFTDSEDKAITLDEAIELGAGVWVWSTRTVFLTRAEGEAYLEATSYKYPHGARVYCVPAHGALCEALGAATEGGRYQ